jgi:hypothetical protein
VILLIADDNPGLIQVIELVEFPSVAALDGGALHVGAHHPGHELGLVLVGRQRVDGAVVAALGTGDFGEGESGVEDMRFVEDVLLGDCVGTVLHVDCSSLLERMQSSW